MNYTKLMNLFWYFPHKLSWNQHRLTVIIKLTPFIDFHCQSDHNVNLSRPQSCAGMWCSCSLLLHRPQMTAACVQLLLAATLWTMPHMGAAAAAAAVLSSSTELLSMTRAGPATQSDFRVLTGAVGAPRSRRKRAISSREINALLDYHNRVRSQVFPPAANMEFMVRKHWTVDQTRDTW